MTGFDHGVSGLHDEAVYQSFVLRIMNMAIEHIGQWVSRLIFPILTWIAKHRDDRVAFIAQSVNIIKRIAFSNLYNYLDAPNSSLIRGTINAMPVSFAKGLEFETVFVMLEEMSQNEMYVAMTRALNCLYIIDG